MAAARQPEVKQQTCGDQALDKLVASGDIRNLKTCCGNGVYNDHDLSLEMKDNTKIISHSDSLSKSLAILTNTHVYTRTRNDLGMMRNHMLFLFAPQAAAAALAPRSEYSYTKAPLSADGKPNTRATESINADEFNVLFGALHPDIQTALTRRDRRGESLFISKVFYAERKVAPEPAAPAPGQP